ncbi:TIR domain-containing protein [Rhizobium ruizarguesonis]|uniref:toll/interleukin-1 receptor domain-containing protein n=1 Tax=Rhizobium ruizarguesonis TaxID=2081791 RepID=UPI00102F9CF0|nr:toll/interleukin-1 receptor domain-containing protein [Rhizobium ruizarguesonis]TAX74981.1 TIR domain-containing protein [Rhizobium ruizarguesonis]
MKVFISHSSKDKHFARMIADEIGDMRCEFDEYSFEFTLNSQAIRQALSRCEVFAFLLSQNSIHSNFVAEELRAAMEGRGAGRIKDVLIFTIDNTAYTSLPEWMREINIVQRLRTPKQVATRIDARLTEAALRNGELTDFYFGRDDEEQKLRLALARSKKESPLVVHVIGHSGVGRRSFLRHALKKAAPRHYSTFVELEINEYDAVDDIYRKLYDYMEDFQSTHRRSTLC